MLSAAFIKGIISNSVFKAKYFFPVKNEPPAVKESSVAGDLLGTSLHWGPSYTDCRRVTLHLAALMGTRCRSAARTRPGRAKFSMRNLSLTHRTCNSVRSGPSAPCCNTSSHSYTTHSISAVIRFLIQLVYLKRPVNYYPLSLLVTITISPKLYSNSLMPPANIQTAMD